jgi:hypothetical protein
MSDEEGGFPVWGKILIYIAILIVANIILIPLGWYIF